MIKTQLRSTKFYDSFTIFVEKTISNGTTGNLFGVKSCYLNSFQINFLLFLAFYAKIKTLVIEALDMNLACNELPADLITGTFLDSIL